MIADAACVGRVARVTHIVSRRASRQEPRSQRLRLWQRLLDRYLRQQARQDAEERVAAAFVLVDSPNTRVLGYYTLSASVVSVGELPREMAKKLPRYPQLPATRLGRLAVDRNFKGKGLGERLLMDALRRSLCAAAEIAAMAVLVDAKDAAAEAFCKHFDFIPLQAHPARLFLPMKTVAALLG